MEFILAALGAMIGLLLVLRKKELLNVDNYSSVPQTP